MKTIFRACLMAVVFLVVIACGQKGPLILPDESVQETLSSL